MSRILVVDDDPHVRRLSQFVLADAGFEVLVACDGREGLEILAGDSPSVIVLDLRMPVMNGREFFRSLDPSSRPLVLILAAEDAHKARAELGADASLDKPFLPEELVEKVSDLIAA